MNDKPSGDFIDFNNKWSYPLQWIWESVYARLEYAQWCFRIDLAMQGKPWKNLYKDEMVALLDKMPEDKRKLYADKCKEIPEGRSLLLSNAVNNRANQMASGVDTYEYQINDPYGIIEADTEELLAAQCEQDYVNNKLETFSATFSRDLTKYGLAAVMVKYNPHTEKNEIMRINPRNAWWDTMYSSTGKERFRGYSTMIDWNKLKKMIEEDGDEINLNIKAPDESVWDEKGKLVEKAKYSHRKIRSLNGLDIYVRDLNRMAVAPGLQMSNNWTWEYTHDLRDCYNLNWYHSWATDPKQKVKNGYGGMDVELTVMYDLERQIEFKIINRRFVVSMNKAAFRRNIAYPIYNPLTDETTWRIDKFHLDCPLKFQREEQENSDVAPYPTSPLFALLDHHDELCAWRAKRSHVAKILAVLRIVANGHDSKNLVSLLNVMGIILDSIQGDIQSVALSYDYSHIDSQIEHLENTIQYHLNAFTQFDAMQMMGDRASAAESGMAVGAIAQGLATHQNAIMQLYADIARQCIGNRVVYSPTQELPIVNRGNYSTVTIQQMALDAIVTVRSKMAQKVQERLMATNAITMLGSLGQQLSPELQTYLITQALYGNVPRKIAETGLQQQGPSEAELALAQQQAQNDAMALQQNQQMYLDNPVGYEVDNVMQSNSPEEIDDVVAALGVNSDGTEVLDEASLSEQVAPLDMASQEGGLAVSMDGMTSDMGSLLANANGVM